MKTSKVSVCLRTCVMHVNEANARSKRARDDVCFGYIECMLIAHCVHCLKYSRSTYIYFITKALQDETNARVTAAEEEWKENQQRESKRGANKRVQQQQKNKTSCASRHYLNFIPSFDWIEFILSHNRNLIPVSRYFLSFLFGCFSFLSCSAAACCLHYGCIWAII